MLRLLAAASAAWALCLALPIPCAAASAASDTDAPRFSLPTTTPFSRLELFDGGPASGVSNRGAWRQMYFELRRGQRAGRPMPSLAALREHARAMARGGVIPLALLDARYERDAQTADEANGATTRSLFALTAWRTTLHRGASLRFVLDEDWVLPRRSGRTDTYRIDFDDGLGSRTLRIGEPLDVSYSVTGAKRIRLERTSASGEVLRATTRVEIAHLTIPTPHDTLPLTAQIPFEGGTATGEAFVYLAEGHTEITRPVVAVEGFDIDNASNWDELYVQLNQENLVEDVRAEGLDLVLLNFTDATDSIQRNGFLLVELLTQIQALLPPEDEYDVIGASMGGLVSRYALLYMESHTLPHRVRTWITYDSPHRGANIPLGIQYWLAFFQEDSADAAELLGLLRTPAARQQLVYLATDPPETSPTPDSLHTAFFSELSGMGSYPAEPRRVAFSNGSASAADQGFVAGGQIIEYIYDGAFVDIIGNVWAVPNGGSGMIFDGFFDTILTPAEVLQVSVSGTLPYDNAPGGTRNSMAQMDSTEAPFGDIVALYDDHCFIPTVSAIDLPTGDLFYDVSADTNLAVQTPFDAVYVPGENEEHVTVTAVSKQWLLDELLPTVVAVDPGNGAPRVLRLAQNAPNPFLDRTTIAFRLPQAGAVRLRVFDLRGRTVATLLEGRLPAGDHTTSWDGTDRNGVAVSSGLYFYRLETPFGSVSRRLVFSR